jgi:predicted DNA-binding transcriptional regulator AlpA
MGCADSDLLGINQTCVLAGMSRATLYRRMADEHFPFPSPDNEGGRLRWSKESVKAWLLLHERIARNRVPDTLTLAELDVADVKRIQRTPPTWKPWTRK